LLQLAYLDECGFAPSQPVTYSWVRPRERKRVPYENPQRRRYNTLVLYAPDGPAPALDWYGTRQHLTADDLLGFLVVRPPSPVPLVVVLDNASFHRSRDVQEARPALWARGIYLYYLPPYSPELNDVERLFRTIKHHDLPERTYTPLTALVDAVEGAFARREAHLLVQHSLQPRLAA
jgi:putative transposase